jgi:hypothetical protein
MLDLEPQVKMAFKRTFDRVSKAHAGDIVMSVTPVNCFDLRWFMQKYPLEVDPAADAAIEAGEKVFAERRWNLHEISKPDYVPTVSALALPLRNYQQLAVDLAYTSGSILVGDDVGLGKTPTGIGIFSIPEARPALVVTLTHLTTQWQDQVNKFLPGMRVHILEKSKPYRLDKNRHGYDFPYPDVIICNYHKLAGWGHVLAGSVQTVVFDEVQELRREESQKYAAAQLISEQARYQVGLTATPIYNYGIEIFNVMNSLKPGVLGTREEFCREWCGGSMDVKARITEPRAFGKFLREEGYMIRRTRKEVGRELPALSVNTHHVAGDLFHIDKVSVEVAEMAKLLLASTGTGLDKMKAGSELNYKLRRATGMAKATSIAAFVKLMLEAGEKVVLFGWHRDVYSIWADELSEYDPGWITGKQTPKQKELHKARFLEGPDRTLWKRNSGELEWLDGRAEEGQRGVVTYGTNLLIMSLRSGAGLDGLQDVCSTVVIGELDWSPGVHTQCIGRIYRDGQKNPVMVYVMVTDEGSDPVVLDVCQIKHMQLTGINDPDAEELIEELTVDPDHMKKLARRFLDAHEAKAGVR